MACSSAPLVSRVRRPANQRAGWVIMGRLLLHASNYFEIKLWFFMIFEILLLIYKYWMGHFGWYKLWNGQFVSTHIEVLIFMSQHIESFFDESLFRGFCHLQHRRRIQKLWLAIFYLRFCSRPRIPKSKQSKLPEISGHFRSNMLVSGWRGGVKRSSHLPWHLWNLGCCYRQDLSSIQQLRLRQIPFGIWHIVSFWNQLVNLGCFGVLSRRRR